jgi:hypothetical protein
VQDTGAHGLAIEAWARAGKASMTGVAVFYNKSRGLD